MRRSVIRQLDVREEVVLREVKGGTRGSGQLTRNITRRCSITVRQHTDGKRRDCFRINLNYGIIQRLHVNCSTGSTWCTVRCGHYRGQYVVCSTLRALQRAVLISKSQANRYTKLPNEMMREFWCM